MRWAILSVLMASFVIACSQSFVCPDGTLAASAAACPAATVEPTTPPAGEESPTAAPPEVPIEREEPPRQPMDPELVALLERYEQKVSSIAFTHAPIEMTSTGPGTVTKHRYEIKGDLARVSVALGTSFNPETMVDTVYLDFAEETASGYCLSRLCSVQGEQRDTSFAAFDVKRPHEWIADIPSSARIAGDQIYENRNAVRVRYEDDGHYEVFIDSFTGTPMSVSIYDDENYRTLRGGVEYHDIDFNKVTDDDVRP